MVPQMLVSRLFYWACNAQRQLTKRKTHYSGNKVKRQLSFLYDGREIIGAWHRHISFSPLLDETPIVQHLAKSTPQHGKG
jgi:hypothetical protein